MRAIAIFLALALSGCAGLPTFYPAKHGYDPMLSVGVRDVLNGK